MGRWCRSFGVELIPILFNVWMILGVLLTFVLAVLNDHVLKYDKPYPPIPYISNTGSYPPESCVFSFVLSCGAIIAFVIIWIRYRHIKGHYVDSPAKLQLLNVVSFFFGFLSIFGLLLVGSFQDVNISAVHFIGAVGGFIFGGVYAILQSWLSYRMRRVHRQHIGCCTLIFRIVLSLGLVFSVPIVIAFGVGARVKGCPDNLREYPGPHIPTNCYAEYILSVGAEWLSLLLITLYFLTFHPDFKRIHADLHVRLRHHHGDMETSILDESTPLTL